MQLKSLELVKRSGTFLDGAEARVPAALRLLQAERSDEVFPILLEEIVKLGFPRALVLSTNFETGEVVPAGAIKCSEQFISKFRSSLYAADHPIINIFHKLQPAILPKSHSSPRPLYSHAELYVK